MTICQPEEKTSFSSEGPSKVLLSTGPNSRVTLWCLEPGQEIHPHSHAGDHIWAVLRGEGWYLSAEGEHGVAPGTLVFAPAGEVHGMRAASRLVFTSVSAGE